MKVKYTEILQSMRDKIIWMPWIWLQNNAHTIFPSVDMEECVNDKVYDKNENFDEEKEENETTDFESTTFD